VTAPRLRRRLTSLAAVAVVAIGLSVLDSTPASAAGVGYVRLAHLSPDTPNVDVYLSSPTGAIPAKTIPGVGYGVVSDYLTVPAGTYAVAMRNAGAAASSPPVLTTEVSTDASRRGGMPAGGVETGRGGDRAGGNVLVPASTMVLLAGALALSRRRALR
jgi:hypothetical protein